MCLPGWVRAALIAERDPAADASESAGPADAAQQPNAPASSRAVDVAAVVDVDHEDVELVMTAFVADPVRPSAGSPPALELAL